MKLMLGDCLERMKEIPDGCIDMVLTDPPYGISYKSGRQGIDRIKSNARQGDDVVRDAYFSHIANDSELPVEWLYEAYRVLRDNSAIYVFGRWDKWSLLASAIQDAGFALKNMIVLYKSNHGMGDLKGSYAPKHELLAYAVKGKHALQGKRLPDVWEVPVKFSGARRHHPNEKPLSWLTPAIEKSTEEGCTVLDPFAGSGTTGVACVNTNRDFIGIELDKEYFRIAKKRILEARGKI